MMRDSNSLCAWSFLLLLLSLLLLSVDSAEEQNSGCSSGEVRLVDGKDEYEGRVEICLDGEWGTVCDYWPWDNNWAWDDNDATVVCRQLGFINKGSTELGIAAYFGEGSGPIHIESIDCNGTELALNDCQYYNNYDCMHSQDAGALCPTGCESGAIRLSSGNHFVGRVEICLHGLWGRVCDDEWDDIDVTVVCRQLGFTLGGTAIFLYYPPYIGRGPIWMDNVACTGNESRLIRCDYESNHDCDSYLYNDYDAGVICSQASQSPLQATPRVTVGPQPQHSVASTISPSPLQASPRVTVGPQPQHNAALNIAMGTVCTILSIAVICLVAALVVILVRKKRTKSVTKQDSIMKETIPEQFSIHATSPCSSRSHSDAVNNPVYNESQFGSVARETAEQQSGDYSTVLNPLYSATAPTYTEVTDTDKHPALHKHMQHTEPQPYEVPVSTQNCNYAASAETTETKNTSSKKNQPPSRQLPPLKITTELEVPESDSHNVSHSDGATTGDYSTLSTDEQCATLEPYNLVAGKTPHESNVDESDYSHLQHHL